MSRDIPLKCRCGAVTGVAVDVDPERGNRLVCMCDDCRAYLHWLERADLLDENGGTEIFQLTPAQVRITAGHDRIACVRLSEKGLMRWYASCCNTPIANTLAAPRAPFLGMPTPLMDHDARDEALGPIIARVHARFGEPPLPPQSHPRAPLWLILRTVRQLARGYWSRAHAPSPVFDASGQPVATPRVLSVAERDRLR